MITIQNRQVDLPADLMLCPVCSRAQLAWDGRNAWRCETAGCGHALALGALFEDAALETRLAVSRVDFSTVRMTLFALGLARNRMIVFPWLTERGILERMAAHDGLEDRDEELRTYDLMLRGVQRRTGWRGIR